MKRGVQSGLSGDSKLEWRLMNEQCVAPCGKRKMRVAEALFHALLFESPEHVEARVSRWRGAAWRRHRQGGTGLY